MCCVIQYVGLDVASQPCWCQWCDDGSPASVLPLICLCLMLPVSPWLIIIIQILWTFSIYLESVAILPQLFMITKTGEAESITTHYLFFLGLYRALYLANWVWRYHTEGFFDQIAVVSGVVQTIFYCDFFYLYVTRGKLMEDFVRIIIQGCRFDIFLNTLSSSFSIQFSEVVERCLCQCQCEVCTNRTPPILGTPAFIHSLPWDHHLDGPHHWFEESLDPIQPSSNCSF